MRRWAWKRQLLLIHTPKLLSKIKGRHATFSKRCLLTFLKQLMVHGPPGLTERHTSINSGILSGSPVHSSNIFSIPQALCWWLWQTQDVHIIVPLKSDLPAHNRILTSCSPFLCCFPLSRTTLVFLCWILLLHSALATSSSGGPCVIYWRWHGFMSHTALPGFPFIPILLPSIFFCASSEFDRIKFHMDKTFQKLCVSSDQSKYRRMHKP